MNVFLTIAFLLSVVFAAHLVWWRVAVPRRQRSALLLLFFTGSLTISPLAAFTLQKAGFAPLSWVQWLNVALGVLAFTLAYVVTYSALEADSPTLSLIRHVATAGSRGLTLEDLQAFMNERPFVTARLSALLEDGMLSERGGRYLLAEHPYTLFRLVLFHRHTVLGLVDDHGG
ncbi:MAG: hypothetical protein IAE97_05955 [Chthoniobacterales bacterium]|nr:hypothetical protein [Chthoniobacterales bacterium]